MPLGTALEPRPRGALAKTGLERGLHQRLTGHLVMARDVPLNDDGTALGQAHAAVPTLFAEGTGR